MSPTVLRPRISSRSNRHDREAYLTLRFQYPWKTSTVSHHFARRTCSAGVGGAPFVPGTEMPSRSERTVSA